MTKPEFTVPVGNVGKRLRQLIDLPQAADLTGATAVLKFRTEGSVVAATERAATISNASPSLAAAISFEIALTSDWEAADLSAAGRKEFQWEVTLANDTPLNLPEKAPTSADPDREWQVMEIVDTL